MKIFINNRNWLTWPREMALLLEHQDHEVIFLDNASTYEPLLDWYPSSGFEVIYLPNLGSTAAWQAGIGQAQTEYYVVTDPDYDLSMVPADWEDALMEGFRYFNTPKVGLSWDESQVPQENPAWILDNMHIHTNDNGIAWNPPLPHNFFGYPCDTSFAIYPPHSGFSISGIRKGRPYTGVHLPWHLTLDPAKDPTKRYVLYDDEAHYYFTHVENSSCTLPRLQGMIREYETRIRG